MKQPDEGHIPYKNYKTYYKVVGEDTGKPPLLVLHGGPGSAHNYMLALAALAEEGRQIVFYDQLGGGISDRPKDDSLWTTTFFVEEVDRVRKHLGLQDIHLLGHSWGGMLAIEYMLTKPKGVRSITLASAMISMPLYQTEVEKLKKDLPDRVYAALIKHETAGTTDSAEYAEAMRVYDARHIFRGKLWPKQFSSANPAFGDSYKLMWGASEAYANGRLKKWDKLNQLKEITIPTLITSGQYDELTPEQALITQANIPGSEIKIFTAGSHCAHIEYPEEYVAVVEEFLSKHD